MSVQAITYEDFQKTPAAFNDIGRGPWTGALVPAVEHSQYFISSTAAHCGGACLQLQIFVPKNEPVYSVTYSANISMDMTKYGNTDTLDFTWTYWPIYAAKNTLNTSTVPIRTQINSVVFDDASAGAPFGPFYFYHVWTGSLISHSGTTTVNKGLDNTRGYISIVISYSTVPDNNTRIDQFTKGISFKITTPTQNVTAISSSTSSGTTQPVSGSASGSTSGSGLLPLPTFFGGLSQGLPSVSGFTSDSASNSTSSSGLLPLPTLSDGPSQGLPSGSLSASSPSYSPSEPNTFVSQGSKMSTAGIGGIVVGSIALLAILVILSVLYRGRKKRNRLASWEKNEAAPIGYPHEKDEQARSISVFTDAESLGSMYKTPIVLVSHSPSEDLAPPLVVSHSPASHEASIPTANHTHLPIHENVSVDEHYDYVQPAFPALSRWATANRALIGQDLEARLEAAGYLPTDNPDNLSEEEWITEHNVTKLEVMRIRALYQAYRQGNGNTPG